MQPEVARYLEEVRTHLHLDPRTEKRVISELSTHFEEKLSDLYGQGMPEADAARAALDSFGDARWIARLMYESYSRGSWTEALISCQPHLILAALFATHVWRHPLLLGVAFATIIVIALLGWRSGSPAWLYSWVGYSLLPLLVASYFSMDPVAQTLTWLLGGRGSPAPLWHLLMYLALYAVTLRLIVSTAVVVARRDWILLSLMLLPLPVLVLWLVTVTRIVGFFSGALPDLAARFNAWDGAMAYFFVALGMMTALFVRVRRRFFKVGTVIVVGIIGSAMAASSLWGGLPPIRFLAVLVCLTLFLTVPLLLHTMLGHEQDGKGAIPKDVIPIG
jgi:hypothetical protein